MTTSAVKNTFGTAKPVAGKMVKGRLRVATFPDGRRSFVPIHVLRGNKPNGPIVLMMTGAHGDEINGPEAVRRVMTHIKPADLHGTLVVLPIINPWGFKARTREVSIDGRDLNRSFPGSAKGSFSQQVADTIFQLSKVADTIIDVHDAGVRNVLFPHPRVHAKPANDRTRELGLSFGSDLVMLRDAEPGMLAGVARKRMKKPVLTVEIGGAFRVWESFQRRSQHGLLNVLREAGILGGKLVLPKTQLLVHKTDGTVSTATGIQSNLVELGQAVKKDQLLFRVYNPSTGDVTQHRSDRCGVVISTNVLGHIAKGEPALTILPYESCKTAAPAHGEIICNVDSDRVSTFESKLSWVHPEHSKFCKIQVPTKRSI